ncbi:hypothetical protein BDW67DRAFT_53201 [Aspergillus spinulosporus]
MRHGLHELTCMAGVPEPESNSWGERVVDREEFMRPWRVYTAPDSAIADYNAYLQAAGWRESGFWDPGPGSPQSCNGHPAVSALRRGTVRVHCVQGAYCANWRCFPLYHYPAPLLTLIPIYPGLAQVLPSPSKTATSVRAISWAYRRNQNLSRALSLYGRVRSPHYKALYSVIHRFRESDVVMEELNLKFDEAVEHTVREQ